MVTDGTYNCMFVIADNSVVAFDAPQPLVGKLRPAIADVTDRPVKYLVYSHAHVDHIGAAATEFGEDKPTIVAHENVASVLRDLRDPARPPPDEVVTGQDGVYVADGLEISFKPLPGVHDATTTLLYMPALRLVMFVDSIIPGGWTLFRCALAEYVRSSMLCSWRASVTLNRTPTFNLPNFAAI